MASSTMAAPELCPPGFDCLKSLSCPAPEVECPLGFFCSKWNDKGLEESEELGRAVAKATFGTEEGADELVDDWRTTLPASRFFAGECLPGYFCSNTSSLQPCPVGHWCGELTVVPRPCDAPSSCALEGLSYQVTFALPVLTALLTLILLTAACWLRQTQRRREAASRKRQSAVPAPRAADSGIDKKGVENESTSIGHGSGVPFHVRNLRMSIRDRVVLSDVSLPVIQPGQLNVILGPSGAGKTLLLQVLRGTASSMPHTTLSGSMRVGNTLLDLSDPSAAARMAALVPPGVLCYVPKADVVDRTATVREALIFSARARLPDSMSSAAVTTIVEKTLDLLQLQGVADVVIGGSENAPSNISGGQLKRVNIGLELVAQPRVLLLDEPSAGLDASVALDLIAALHDLAVSTNITIVSVLHQPRSEAFTLFHQIILLAQGQVAYAGAPQDAVPYFSSLSIPLPSPAALGRYVMPGSAGTQGTKGDSAVWPLERRLTGAQAQPDSLPGPDHMELEQGVRAMNPADWIVDIAAGLIQPTPLQADGSLTVRGLMRGLALTVELGAVWRESVAANKGAAVGNGLETEDAAAKKMEAGAQEDEGLQAQTSSLPVQLWIQTRRGLVTRFRDHRKLALFTLLHIGMAVALSVGFSIYIQGSYRSTLSPPLSNTLKAYCPSIVRGLCERNNGDLAFQQLLFFISFAVGSITAQAAIGLFGMEGSGPAQIRRECGDSGLSPLMFGVGRMLADLPIIAWNTSLFAAVWMLMGHVGKWYYWLAIVLATGFAASGLGYVASLLTRPANAAVVVMIATITQSVFSGVEPQLRLVDPLPVVNWAWYTSYAAYVAEATYVTWTEHMVDTESGHGSVQQGADYYGFEVRQGIGRPIAALFALGLMWRAVALYILWRTARPQQSVSALQWALALLKCK